MPERIKDKQELKDMFVSQPTIGTILRVLDNEVYRNSHLEERLGWVGISGSKARHAGLEGKNGVVSDEDLVIILKGSSQNDPLNMQAYEQVLDCINQATKIMVEEKGIIPVYASTIRLEDAQMALARLIHASGQIRMIHSLIYPSPEAVVAFEPPLLARNLVGQALTLWGDERIAEDVNRSARNGARVENINLTIGGLDGISDNFRMLRTNRHVLPALFLGPQAVHVLDYSVKWAMAQVVEKAGGAECATWGEIIDNFPSEEGGQLLIEVVKKIRLLRAQEEHVDLDELENLYREVISLWPLFTSIRSGK